MSTRRLAFHETVSCCAKLCARMRIWWFDRARALYAPLAHGLWIGSLRNLRNILST